MQKEKDQLVKKVLACQVMASRNSRTLIVEELSFANSIVRDSLSSDTDDVISITKRCSELTYGFQELYERMVFHDKDVAGQNSRPVQELGIFLEMLISSPRSISIDINALIELYKLTEQIHIPKDDLYDLYSQADITHSGLPDAYQSSDDDKTLHLMMQYLAQAGMQNVPPQNKLTHPLLTLVQLLIEYVPDPLKNALRDWLMRTADSEHITLEAGDSADKTGKHTAKEAYYYLVKLEAGESGDEFDVSAWLLRQQNGKTTPIDGYSKEGVAFQEIPTLLASQCRRYARRLTVEIFLPFTLLNVDSSHAEEYDVHMWRIESGFDSIKLDHKYPLVLRSYDRLYSFNDRPDFRAEIRQAWECNWAVSNSHPQIDLKWPLKEKASCHRDLAGWLQDAAFLNMLFVPPAFIAGQPHIFKKMLTAGTSVALWPRSSCPHMDEAAMKRAYCDLFQGCRFSIFPITVWEKRKAESIDETSVVNYLTLLWDDPSRLPNDAPDAPDRDVCVFPVERK